MLCSRHFHTAARAISSQPSLRLPSLPRPAVVSQLGGKRRYSIPSTMSTSTTPLLITPQRLASLLMLSSAEVGKRENVRVLDATWFMPNVQRDPRKEHLQGPRIPQSTFWDVEQVASLRDEVDAEGNLLNPLGLGHMMPSREKFAAAAARNGITNDTLVVVSDSHGIFSSPRTAFTFYAFGHDRISILDGGLPGWLAEGLPVEDSSVEVYKPDAVEYEASPLRSGMIRSYDEMVANARMANRGQTVLDARPYGRFTGEAPEPRPGLPSGHIPSSKSIPFASLLDTHPHPTNTEATFTTLKTQTDLWRTISDSLGGMEELDKLRQGSSSGELAATNTCGSGMTAAVVWLALNQLGIQSAIYDEVSKIDEDERAKDTGRSGLINPHPSYWAGFQSWTGYAQRKESVIDTTHTEAKVE